MALTGDSRTGDGGPSLSAAELTATVRADAEGEEIDLEEVTNDTFGEGDTVAFDAPSAKTSVDITLEAEVRFRSLD